MAAVDVLHVCFGGLGGIRSVVNTLTAKFAEAGLSTGVVAIGRRDELMDARSAWPGTAVVEPVVLHRRADLASMVQVLSAGRRVRSRAVLVHSPRHAIPIFLARVLGRQSPRLVAVEHSSVHDRSVFLDANSASSLLCSRAVVFLTAENRARYPLGRMPLPALRHTRVIANGVRLEDFPSDRSPVSWDSEELRIGMAARVVASKDFDTLIRAMALLQQGRHYPPVRLVVAGDGPDLARVRALARSCGADTVIDFIGSVPESGVPAFLAGLDAYVHATHGETLSMSLLKAAAARRPIVASDVAGVHDVFVHGVNACLTRPGDAREMADGIAEVLSNPEFAMRLSTNAHDLVAAKYTATRMACSYLRLLDEIDARGPWRSAALTLTSTSTRAAP